MRSYSVQSYDLLMLRSCTFSLTQNDAVLELFNLQRAYSLPNTVLPLFAGVLTDRVGYRPMTVATTFLALCGSLVVLWGVAVKVRLQCNMPMRHCRPSVVILSILVVMHLFRCFFAACACAVPLQSWPLMWAGRAVYGVGTESMCVAQRTLVSNWFLGKELGE